MTILAIENNLRKKMQYIASKLPCMQVQSLQDASLVDTKLPSDTFNTVFGGFIDNKLTTEIFSYYKNNNRPMTWWIGPSSTHPLAYTFLKQAGFTQDESSIGMTCDLALIPDAIPSAALTIRICKNTSDFMDFSKVLSSVFDPIDDQIPIFYQKMATLSNSSRKDMILFVGYEKEKPVATSCLFLTEVAGIYDVVTRPEKRNKGYGSSLFYYALLEAKKSGYLQAILQASSEGLNLYKRLGFKEICTFTTWTNKKTLHLKN